jgi:type II secretory ATPase GspE/PulE/Tfp pilus assembly ATPase PilB-like protein
MEKTQSFIGQILLDNNMVTPDKLEVALNEQKRTGELTCAILLRMGVITHNDLARALAIHAQVPFISLDKVSIDPVAFHMISLETIEKYMVVPFAVDEKILSVAMENPNNIHAIDTLRRETDKRIKIHVADLFNIRYAIDIFSDTGKSIEEEIESNLQAALEMIITKGIHDHATDIHITPEEKAFRVSYRVDGIMHSGMVLPKHLHMPILNKIKIASGMNIAEQRSPQDGNMSFEFTGRSIDIRSSTSPCSFGENLVLRLLDKSRVLLDLQYLGLEDRDRKDVERLAQRPHGIILNSGPTGSGKTTTLYAMLQSINTLEKNVLTIEDPIEYRLPFIKQTQVNEAAGLTFAEAIRHFFRQDPDIILIGEIRDLETARVAMQAAMTGHLVLSTIHTNDSVATIPRLLDLGIEPYLVSSTMRAVIAQRLVRTICNNCREEHEVDIEFASGYGLGEWAAENRILKRGSGCEFCEDIGYFGRIGIFEILEISNTISGLILEKMSTNKLMEAAVAEGMTTMRQDGLRKVEKGITTLDEVLKVT